MNTSLSWIKTYVPDLDVTAQEYTDAMTLTGTKVEGFTELDADLDKIVIGQIDKIEKHPDADKLIICQVNIGTESVQIVTGAPNVKEGDKVPVVLDGGRVAGGHDGKMTPGGIKIKKGKLRGVESFGMMCSIEELGSTREMYPEAPEYGIYIFPEDAVVGESAVKALGLDDVVFEYEITSNRVDCYGVLGIAREAAATFQKKFCPPIVEVKENDEKASDYVKVTVEDPELCPRYCARVVKNVKIGPSPKWMQRCLASNGIRPINNLVDITNYVMEEFGQPMHAYDLDTIANQEIIVRRAGKDEKFVTLDGQERIMDENVLMICDGEKAVGIAGIMGGENSMITDDVKTVLFEAACFDGTSIRLSSKRIGLRTDASGKFEKGLDPNNAQAAIDRACQLMEELGAGEVVGGMVDVCSETREPSRVKFEPEKINKLLGTSLTKEEMIDYLGRVELAYDEKTDEIVAPTFRQDIHCNADVAEEVARFYGYDKIPMTLPTGEATTGKLPFKLRIQEVARDIAEYCGFSEGMSYSFESPKVFDKLCIPEDSELRKVITISNPLGEDYSIMRTSTLNGMLASLSTNYNRRNKDVRLYELGNIYLPKSLPVTELPDERTMFTLGMYGKGDFFDMKGVCEEFFEKIGMKKKVTYDPNSGKPFLHPGRQANMIYEGKVVGYLGEVHPAVADNYSIGEKAYIAVIDILDVLEFAGFNHKYTGIAKYPAVTRDLSLVVPHAVLAGQIEEIFDQRGGNILESYQLFDIYEGAQIEKGFKSMAYSLVFRAHDKTLGENEISAAMKKIMNGLNGLGIELRS
ncbi:phenylalanine--tRNA ligase subunit beta [Ruminococcus sp. AM23-1]|jgi:phenylalanyl-tRNA synthetase beta chain|uniref:phenylalanine--tRNA ligase subunit beta n=1 Tax=Clostridia TaxID=186801 RepID=UPI000E4A8AA2|nr:MULTISPECIES: phenylalanine--tRNA ligase subunit beta [Clostridia]RHN90293.1 phenylalanine--tRNA ligase subunit beta [Ruminococcus sp. AM23-1]RHP69975.1 phenylalanine--tRNA ligase subunit beta [Ruminococcus sp. OF02-6]MCJ7862784.1 phenylalanine--tRNA ligase subunit beta [Blautia sp. NSJ-157]MCJ7866055.1 phenylalanine--tRNA ligase subunit beta [Blautia sp. NSJ-140]RHR04665.1 phenylalanine--tRNA ligase subunit beta [Ruminococcus sp. AF20-12LB]